MRSHRRGERRIDEDGGGSNSSHIALYVVHCMSERQVRLALLSVDLSPARRLLARECSWWVHGSSRTGLHILTVSRADVSARRFTEAIRLGANARLQLLCKPIRYHLARKQLLSYTNSLSISTKTTYFHKPIRSHLSRKQLRYHLARKQLLFIYQFAIT
jgi:hypothetical protein